MSDKITLRDAFGQPFEVPAEEGPGGTLIPLQKVQVSGRSVAETLTEADAVAGVLTFSAPITAIEVWHDAAQPQEFVVNGLALMIAPGGWRSPVAGTPAATVAIPAGVNVIVSRLV